MPPTDTRHRFSGGTSDRYANGRRQAPTPGGAYLTGLVTVMKLSCAVPHRQPAFQRQHERTNRSMYTYRSVAFIKVRFYASKNNTPERRTIIKSHTPPRPDCELDNTKEHLTLGRLPLSRREGYGFAQKRRGFTFTCYQGHEQKIAAQHSHHLLQPLPAFITAV